MPVRTSRSPSRRATASASSASSGRSTLTATADPSRRAVPRQTSPDAPRPRGSCSEYVPRLRSTDAPGTSLAYRPPAVDRYLPIEEHGVIGDLHTVALVGIDGTIDWCCLPRFDAPAVFGSLLDAQRGGSMAIRARGAVRHRQLYLPDSNVLMTRFLGEKSVGEVVDFMVPHGAGLNESSVDQ